ncbi:MAG: hypothetical protein JNK22_07575 [Rhodocyclaceae bacterium]|nr:hypothetical protein [Rhodocyclaceae bacterium]
MTLRRSVVAALAISLVPLSAQAFRFSEEEAKEKAAADDAAARAKGAAPAVSPACRERLKNEKVAVLLAERGSKGINADQSRYGMHFQAIDRRLQKQGMRTYTQEEIKKQIAQAEIEAHFRNDPDAALNASRKLGATMFLRGAIGSRTGINPILKINEVYVNMGFTLVGGDGQIISEASASSDSYSGGDTVGMALTLINEQADGVVGRLLRGYCAERGGKKTK